MTTIPLRELRNNVSNVLRRAESGERFRVTVGGRPVAELGPLPTRRWASPEQLRALFAAAPVDAGWQAELLAERDAERRGEFDVT